MNSKTEVLDTKGGTVDSSKRIKLRALSADQRSFLKSSATGLTGVSLGAAAVLLMGMTPGADDEGIIPDPEGASEPLGPEAPSDQATYDIDVCIYSDAPFSEVVTDDMSFGEAYAAARADVGPGGFFEWKGETYNTYNAEEWASMSQDEHNDFFASIDESHIPIDRSEEIATIDILNDDFEDEVAVEAMDHEDIVIDEEVIIYEADEVEDLVIEEDIIVEDEMLSDDFDVTEESDLNDQDDIVIEDDFDLSDFS